MAIFNFLYKVMSMVLIAPSLLSADFLKLGTELAVVENTADLIHLDIMDGHFVPNISFGPLVVSAVRRGTKLPLDVHLMIDNALCYLDDFVKAGATSITIHAENTTHLEGSITAIKSHGIKAGVALNPATSEQVLRYVIDDIDSVLVMSVNPGFGGQQFIASAISKIAALKAMIDNSNNEHCLIAVDGGISDKTIKPCYEAGARMFVAGSYVFGASDPKAAIQKLRDAAA